MVLIGSDGLLKELVNSPPQTVVQEFEIVSNDLSLVVTMNPAERDMVDKLRLLLRDQNPDKYYHFRPPEHESSIGAYNRVFGQVWEDAVIFLSILSELWIGGICNHLKLKILET